MTTTVEVEQQKTDDFDNNPLRPFLFALKAPKYKRQYPKRLKVFFDFEFDKKITLLEQAKLFIEKATTTTTTNNEK